MKITCQSCQAKYTIADEKVAGKVVKIRCKKCGATIVVNGGDSAGAATDSVRTAEGVAAEGWTVNVGDGDQRTMTDDEIVAAYRSQVIDDETYCWKEGMGDWAPLREIPTLYDACTAAQAGARQAPASSRLAHHAKGSGSGPAPVAARRTGGRAGAADLFGTAAQAGSDDDVMTSAPAKMTRSRDDARSVSGGRADSDVLFSLSASAMTSKSERHPPASANTEGSGLIDIRQLAEQLRAQDSTNKRKSSNRVDDIMNLSGGGAFLPNLSVPSLPPPIDVASIGATAKPSIAPSKGRGVVFLAAGGGLLVILAAIGGTVAVMRGSGDETATAKDRPSASAAASAAAASLAAAPSESAAPAASESAAAAPDQSANEAPVASASAS
ncbi:MAG: zinc-ribbon domain-containing protein, partial [Polyangiaceae bacterium]|nr:zinc-ribbon domain-containing protein [Polyangiaceae bacterium]